MKRSPLIILFVTIFIDLLGFGLILPNIPVYIQHYGGAPWVGGLLLASYSITQFVFAPIWGRLSDRVGRRPLILLSLLGSAVSFFFFGWAPNLAILFIARVSAGILSSASLPTAQAYIGDVTPPEKRAGGMAIIGAAFGLGFVLGPVFGGLLSQHPIWHISPIAMPAYAAALLSLANFVMALALLPETHHDRTATQHGDAKGMLDVFPAIARAMRDPVYGPPLLVYAAATFALTALESSFSWLIVLRFDRVIHHSAETLWNRGHAGHLFTSLPFSSKLATVTQRSLVEQAAAAATTSMFIVVGVTTLITQLAVMGGLARKIGEHRLVIIGTIMLTAALAGIAFAGDMMWIRILSAVVAIGNGVLNPSISSLISQTAGSRNRGMISGAQQGLGSLARIVAPPINNTLVGIWTGIPFLASAAVMGGAVVLSFGLRPLGHGTPEARDETSAANDQSSTADTESDPSQASI